VGGVDWPCDGASAGEGGNLLFLDVNGSGSVNLTDAVAILNYLFLSGAPPFPRHVLRALRGLHGLLPAVMDGPDRKKGPGDFRLRGFWFSR
jgi:hypothetical protein